MVVHQLVHLHQIMGLVHPDPYLPEEVEAFRLRPYQRLEAVHLAPYHLEEAYRLVHLDPYRLVHLVPYHLEACLVLVPYQSSDLVPMHQA